jgi:hypothetical protein
MGNKFKSADHVFNYVRKCLVNKDIDIDFNDIVAMCVFLYSCQESRQVFNDNGFMSPLDYYISKLSKVDSKEDFAFLHNSVGDDLQYISFFLGDSLVGSNLKELKKYETPVLAPLSERYLHEIEILTFKNKAELSTKFEDLLNRLQGKAGLYKIYNGSELVYLGKSKNLSSRILGSLKERGGSHVSYLEIDNHADMHILEPYLVATLTPKLNTEFITSQKPSYILAHNDFSELVPVFNQ